MTDYQPTSNYPQWCSGDRWPETVWVPSSPLAVNNNLRKGLGLITQSLPGWGWETAVSIYADGRPPLVLVKQADLREFFISWENRAWKAECAALQLHPARFFFHSYLHKLKLSSVFIVYFIHPRIILEYDISLKSVHVVFLYASVDVTEQPHWKVLHY